MKQAPSRFKVQTIGGVVIFESLDAYFIIFKYRNITYRL